MSFYPSSLTNRKKRLEGSRLDFLPGRSAGPCCMCLGKERPLPMVLHPLMEAV